jgi:uncharacterized repeat protein (TIGR01451 family)
LEKKMNKSTRRQGLSALTITLVILVLVASGLRPSAADNTLPSIPRPQLILRAGYSDSTPRKIPPPPGLGKKPGAATITVDYVGTWDAPAQAAFQYAVDIWESEINASVEIVVEAHWSALGEDSGILGGAMGDIVTNFNNAPQANTWYPAALGHTLAGADVNDNDGYDFNQDGSDADPEILAEFNRDFTHWYFGTDGNTPFENWDFASVVLHELGHGLGFAGSMIVYSNGLGYWGYGTPYPAIYDRFTENGSGQLLIDNFANGSVALAAQLQSDNLFFDGPNAKAANGGNPPKLYVPTSWQQGSSYSHLDETTFNGTPNALMTPTIYNGESIHDPGPIMRGIFEDMGWSFEQASPDLRLSMNVSGDPDPAPGEQVTFVLSVENVGNATATGIVLTDNLPEQIVPGSWIPSGALIGATERVGTTYVWDLPDLAAGESGAISILGTIAPDITAHMLIVNQASISSDEDSDTDNNSSVAAVGGDLNYLPLAIRD